MHFIGSVNKTKFDLLANRYGSHKEINKKYHDYFDAEELNLIPDFFLEDLKELEEYGIGQKILIADANYGGLQWLLTKWDKASMASSVEIRSPFLDYNFFQYSLALPDAFRIKGGKNKAILRDAFEDILTPSLVSDKRKQGLAMIKNNYDDSYLKYIQDLYSNRDFLDSKLWDGKKISSDFELAKNNEVFDKIEQLDVFFKLISLLLSFIISF